MTAILNPGRPPVPPRPPMPPGELVALKPVPQTTQSAEVQEVRSILKGENQDGRFSTFRPPAEQQAEYSNDSNAIGMDITDYARGSAD